MRKGLLTLFVLLFPLVARGQSAGLQISPLIVEKRADPGAVLREELVITNLGENEVVAFPEAREIVGTNTRGQPIFGKQKESFGLPAWIYFEEKEIYLKSGERRSLQAEIRIPENASPGGHFAGIIFKKEADEVVETGAGVGYGVGTIVSIRVSGEVAEEAEIESFTTEKGVYEKPEIKFIALVKNRGSVLIRPIGFIDIEGPGGQKVSLEVNPEAGGVFPGGERLFEVVWKGKKMAWGKYRAIISMVYGEDGRKTISDATEFWILPVKGISGVAGGIVAMLLGVIFGVRLYIRKKVREIEEAAPRVRGTHQGKRRVEAPSAIQEFAGTALLVLGISILIFIFLFLVL